MISRAWGRLAAAGRERPLSLAVASATVKTAAADVLTQQFLEQPPQPQLDVHRVLFFTAFGAVYLGGFQYYLYVVCFGRWFPHARRFAEAEGFASKLRDRAGVKDLALQVAAGNFLHIPFVFLPSFYLMQEACQHGSAASAQRALRSYTQHLWADCVAAWQIWVPGHALFFSVPMWARLPTNHVLSFAYVCVLSLMRGGRQPLVAETDRPRSA